MPDLGPAELIIILAVILLLFGGAKLPQLARSLGQAKKEFQAGAAEGAKPDAAKTEPAKPDNA
jgi:sec-independent protein translocase protein TatA